MSSLRDTVFERLRAAFGEPHRTVGVDRHWALRSLAYMAAINVLCNGRDEFPIVWVFNPHEPKDGVRHTIIRTEAEIDHRDRRHRARRPACRPTRPVGAAPGTRL